jgi:hypothetical protein
LIFSKAKAGRFPVDGEVEDLFGARKPAANIPTAKKPATKPSEEQSGTGGRAGMLRRLTDKFRN